MTTTTFITGTGGGGGVGSSTMYGAIPPIGTITVGSSGTTTTSTITSPFQAGAIGSSSGLVLTSGTGAGSTWVNPHTNIKVTGNAPTLSTDKNTINLDELAEMMSVMRDRFLIIIPNFEKHEKYAALKKAYDHYKLIEAMISEEKK